jgi:mycothiol synthase
MTLKSRMYDNADDLELMKNLLRASKHQYPTSGIHIGDLDWWVFYDTSDVPLQDKVCLWFEDEQLIAWTWSRVNRKDYDMFVHPMYRGTPQQERVFTQTVDRLSALLRQDDSQLEITGYVNEDETAQITLLEQHGFQRHENMINLSMDLRGALPASVLPAGFAFLEQIQPEHVEQRALAHRDAFQPHSKMTAEHYRAFRTAPGYDPQLDIAVSQDDGTIVSFAICWLDPDTQLGLFEPVGTRYEYHRRGLGRATMLEGLRRMQARGIETALVSCDADNARNLAFYQNVGFQISNQVFGFTKTWDNTLSN